MLFTSPHEIMVVHHERIKDGIRAAKRARMVEEVQRARANRDGQSGTRRGLIAVLYSLLTPSEGREPRFEPQPSGAESS
jgi:hypothetical protein